MRAACPECGKTHRIREGAGWCLSVANGRVVHDDLRLLPVGCPESWRRMHQENAAVLTLMKRYYDGRPT